MKSSRRVAVLGATGSIGRQALDVIRDSEGELEVCALACKQNVEGLLTLAQEFQPALLAVADPPAAEQLQRRGSGAASNLGAKVASGEQGLLDVATYAEADLVLNALVGGSGLLPTLAALEADKILALANKESLVMAGSLVMQAAAESGTLVPVDSEHSSLFRCMLGRDPSHVRSITLTGSGGSLRDWTVERMRQAAPEQVLKHPVWHMGKRITVDSATLMNKALEVIEAQYLLGVDLSKINVVIHPQAFVHGLVELEDGTMLAHLSEPDMKIPIAYALYYPLRPPVFRSVLDLAKIGSLTFEQPDLGRFPCLCLGYRAAKEAGTMPAVLNAADEVAVEAFLGRKIGFTEIPTLVQKVMDEHKVETIASAHQVMESDRWARERARSLAEL